MSYKGYWSCKCNLKHKITISNIKNKRFKSCPCCMNHPSKEDIKGAEEQIDDSKKRRVVKAL